jgi:hypothetical protein
MMISTGISKEVGNSAAATGKSGAPFTGKIGGQDVLPPLPDAKEVNRLIYFDDGRNVPKPAAQEYASVIEAVKRLQIGQGQIGQLLDSPETGQRSQGIEAIKWLIEARGWDSELETKLFGNVLVYLAASLPWLEAGLTAVNSLITQIEDGKLKGKEYLLGGIVKNAAYDEVRQVAVEALAGKINDLSDSWSWSLAWVATRSTNDAARKVALDRLYKISARRADTEPGWGSKYLENRVLDELVHVAKNSRYAETRLAAIEELDKINAKTYPKVKRYEVLPAEPHVKDGMKRGEAAMAQIMDSLFPKTVTNWDKWEEVQDEREEWLRNAYQSAIEEIGESQYEDVRLAAVKRLHAISPFESKTYKSTLGMRGNCIDLHWSISRIVDTLERKKKEVEKEEK